MKVGKQDFWTIVIVAVIVAAVGWGTEQMLQYLKKSYTKQKTDLPT